MIGLLDYFLFFPSSSQKAQRHPENKSVLILGAGYVSLPVVEYLAKSKNTEVTVGKYVRSPEQDSVKIRSDNYTLSLITDFSKILRFEFLNVF